MYIFALKGRLSSESTSQQLPFNLISLIHFSKYYLIPFCLFVVLDAGYTTQDFFVKLEHNDKQLSKGILFFCEKDFFFTDEETKFVGQ